MNGETEVALKYINYQYNVKQKTIAKELDFYRLHLLHFIYCIGAIKLVLTYSYAIKANLEQLK